ncbi:MAG: 2-hydroxyhepta-2,4-diene-1,7-dioate isomerase [Anaerolineaceae bacterium]|nr:2-hydroxyhepta-2,4-diene-1,7-dioate isomerase [Anaerolineaceae bacterium]
MTTLVRFFHPQLDGQARIGLLTNDTVYDISRAVPSISAWLRQSSGRVSEAIAELEALVDQAEHSFPVADFALEPRSDVPCLLSPVDEQEVWAAGVTYERSREARQEESKDGGDVYARVYDAERPEIFFKAQGWRAVGPGGEVGIRSDASWSVPEPELGVVYNPDLEPVGFVPGNDMSSRDIEGENPLYLPQAKVYTASCALGPGIVLNPTSDWPQATIRVKIERDGKSVFDGDVHTSKIKRRIDELGQYLGHSYSFPDGVVLLTGTGTVPPADFTLAAGDVVTVSIEGIGELKNRVKVV